MLRAVGVLISSGLDPYSRTECGSKQRNACARCSAPTARPIPVDRRHFSNGDQEFHIKLVRLPSLALTEVGPVAKEARQRLERARSALERPAC